MTKFSKGEKALIRKNPPKGRVGFFKNTTVEIKSQDKDDYLCLGTFLGERAAYWVKKDNLSKINEES